MDAAVRSSFAPTRDLRPPRRRRGSALAATRAVVFAAVLGLGAAPPQTTALTAEPELLLNPSGHSPSVAIDGQGRGVAAWVDDAGSSEAFAVTARRFIGNVPSGASFQVNSVSAGDLRNPAVAINERGDFVVVWHDADRTPAADNAVRGQLYRADGRRRGSELGLSPRGVNAAHPAVAIAADGRLAVAWEQSDPDPKRTVRLATFTAGGGRIASPVVMSALGVDANLVGAVSASARTVAVGWTEVSPCPQQPIDPVSAVATFDWSLKGMREVDRFANDNPCIDGPRVLALPNSTFGPLGIFVGRRYSIQRFSPLTGSRLGPRTDVADLPVCDMSSCERVVAVAGDSRGRFAFIWERYASGSYDLFAELYGREGRVRSERFKVNLASSSASQYPAAALSSDGTLMVVWERDGEGIVARKLFLP